ncbi:hypothetical protein CL629_03565 [bacterium]|nr:hypothetical protein [bacterium]|tara:strand:- start:2348 stop:3718 length:1371 start_codon:yes stop_codon:yes gene_type:complete
MFIHNISCVCERAIRVLLLTIIVATLWSALFVFTYAQTEEAAGIDEVDPAAILEKEAEALRDLAQAVGQEIDSVEEARAVCDQERYLNTCIEIGKKYELYEPEELEQIDEFLEEAKETIINDLQNCTDERCLLDAAAKLAERIRENKPELAELYDFTEEKMEEKERIIEAAEELGVSFSDCRVMDPDTAPVDLLRACARLAKDDRVKEFIPEEELERIEKIDESVEVLVDLREQKLQCGDGTLEGCGQFCLNPGPEAREGGVEGIPEICRHIAERFFGDEGIRQLEAAYEHVGQVEDYLKQQTDNLVFETHDGRKLFRPEEIGRYLEIEGRKGNVEAVEKGMDFLVLNGFVTTKEKEFALEMIKKIKERGIEVDFDRCEVDPRACQDFVPEDFREEFEVMDKIHTIVMTEMQKEGVPNPDFCDDPRYGQGCLAAGKRALPQIEEIAGDFPPALALI